MLVPLTDQITRFLLIGLKIKQALNVEMKLFPHLITIPTLFSHILLSKTNSFKD